MTENIVPKNLRNLTLEFRLPRGARGKKVVAEFNDYIDLEFQRDISGSDVCQIAFDKTNWGIAVGIGFFLLSLRISFRITKKGHLVIKIRNFRAFLEFLKIAKLRKSKPRKSKD